MRDKAVSYHVLGLSIKCLIFPSFEQLMIYNRLHKNYAVTGLPVTEGNTST